MNHVRDAAAPTEIHAFKVENRRPYFEALSVHLVRRERRYFPFLLFLLFFFTVVTNS